MATLEQLERLALASNTATVRYGRQADASSTVLAQARSLVRSAKAVGLQCERKDELGGYDCTDPETRALFQVRVERLDGGALARMWAGVHGLDRARRPSATKRETPLARIRRERDDLQQQLEACQRGRSAVRELF